MSNTCNICEQRLGKILLEINQLDRFEKHVGVSESGYQRYWKECEFCGTASNILPLDSISKLENIHDAYYEIDFAGSSISEKFKKIMSLPEGTSDNSGRVNRIVAYARASLDHKRIKILDIGAGTGVFLTKLLEKTGNTWDCTALEPDPKAAVHLKEINLFEVVEKEFQPQLFSDAFDVITLNKVLEHIEYPVKFLKDAVAHLRKDSGFIYVEVPDLRTINERESTDNILGPLHYHLYSPTSLSYAMDKAGIMPLLVERIEEASGKLTVYAFGKILS